jgi:RNA polymerase sigma factor (sigma-70 family)
VKALEDRAWLEQVYREQIDTLIPMGRYFAKGVADDLLFDAIQEIFLALWRKRAALMNHPNIGGWLVDALKLELRAECRKQRRRAARHSYSMDEREQPTLADDTPMAEELVFQEEQYDLIRQLLGEENAALFIAFTVEGRTAKELAAQYGLSESCIWVRVGRMRKKLLQHPEIFGAFLFLMIGF